MPVVVPTATTTVRSAVSRAAAVISAVSAAGIPRWLRRDDDIRRRREGRIARDVVRGVGHAVLTDAQPRIELVGQGVEVRGRLGGRHTRAKKHDGTAVVVERTDRGRLLRSELARQRRDDQGPRTGDSIKRYIVYLLEGDPVTLAMAPVVRAVSSLESAQSTPDRR